MPIIRHADVPARSFSAGSTYRMIVGDEKGSTPFCVGLQSCEPGYQTVLHSHPYLETITVLAGQGEAWSEDLAGIVRLEPGVTLAFPANIKHRFWALGSEPFQILGVHASPHRIVHVHEETERITPKRAKGASGSAHSSPPGGEEQKG